MSKRIYPHVMCDEQTGVVTYEFARKPKHRFIGKLPRKLKKLAKKILPENHYICFTGNAELIKHKGKTIFDNVQLGRPSYKAILHQRIMFR